MGQTTTMVSESQSLQIFFGGARCDRLAKFPKSYVWVEKCVAKWVGVAPISLGRFGLFEYRLRRLQSGLRYRVTPTKIMALDATLT